MASCLSIPKRNSPGAAEDLNADSRSLLLGCSKSHVHIWEFWFLIACTLSSLPGARPYSRIAQPFPACSPGRRRWWVLTISSSGGVLGQRARSRKEATQLSRCWELSLRVLRQDCVLSTEITSFSAHSSDNILKHMYLFLIENNITTFQKQ